MKYIKKICPICNTEFFVLENVEEKAVFCTLGCMLKAQEDSGFQESV